MNKKEFLAQTTNSVGTFLADPDTKDAVKSAIIAEGITFLYMEYRSFKKSSKFVSMVPRSPQQVMASLLITFTTTYIMKKLTNYIEERL